MRKLQDSELFSKYLSTSEKANMFSALNTQLRYDTGVVKPENLDLTLLDLKKKAKGTYVPLINEAISMFEANGRRIRLFNLTNGSSSPVPSYVPFLPDMSRNFAVDPSEGGAANIPVIFMNLYRIGNWNAEGNEYLNFKANDAYPILESGLLAYKMICRGMSDEVFTNKTVLENLTRIYTDMFMKAVSRAKTNIYEDVAQDTARFIIAKFFLTYVLKKQDSDTTDNYAYLSVKNRTSKVVIKSQEENYQINYNTLTDFLSSFSEAFFNDSLSLVQFINSWVKLYGDGLVLAVEYAPYLIHFLFAALHSTSLGGITRLNLHLPILQDDGLNKLYTAMINILR